MIPNFLQTVCRDCITGYDRFFDESSKRNKEDQKVKLATYRLFAVPGLAVGALTVASAALMFTASPIFAAVLVLPLGVMIYAASHDVFIMCNNREKGVLEKVLSAGKHEVTAGTLLTPLWDKHLLKVKSYLGG